MWALIQVQAVRDDPAARLELARIGSGVIALANNSAASTAFVVGRNRRTNSARIDIDQSGQLDPARHLIIEPDPDVERSGSICIHSPARAATTVLNGPSG